MDRRRQTQVALVYPIPGDRSRPRRPKRARRRRRVAHLPKRCGSAPRTMIDRAKFSAGIGLLGGCFGREIEVPVIRAYFAILNPRLTTAEFERAVTLCIPQEKFWPSPAVLLAKVEKDTDSAALA